MILSAFQGPSYINQPTVASLVAQLRGSGCDLVRFNGRNPSSAFRLHLRKPLVLAQNQSSHGGIVALLADGSVEAIKPNLTVIHLLKIPTALCDGWDRIAVNKQESLVAILKPASENGVGCRLAILDVKTNRIVTDFRDNTLLAKLGLKVSDEQVFCAGWNPGLAFSPDSSVVAVSLADPSTMITNAGYGEPVVRTSLLKLSDGSVRHLSTIGGVLGFLGPAKVVLWRVDANRSHLFEVSLTRGSVRALGSCSYPIMSGRWVADFIPGSKPGHGVRVSLLNLTTGRKLNLMVSPRLTSADIFSRPVNDPQFTPVSAVYGFSVLVGSTPASTQ
jgi:hypothetical protein